jgi:hypothetical protein
MSQRKINFCGKDPAEEVVILSGGEAGARGPYVGVKLYCSGQECMYRQHFERSSFTAPILLAVVRSLGRLSPSSG